MHHAAAAHFQPFAVVAHDVDFGGRLGKGEKRGAETHLQVIALEKAADKIGKHRFQIGHAHAFFHPQAFGLVKHRRMGGVGIDAVNPTGRDDADGRVFLVEHIADLNRRSVRAQNIAVFHIKRILHGARGVVLRNIERLEIMEIVFDFGAVGHFKTDTVKQLHHALQGERHRMQAALSLAAPGQGHIQRLGSQLRLQLGCIERIAFDVIGRLKLIFALIDVRAYGFALFGRHLTEGFQQGVQFAGLAQITGFDQFERIGVCCGFDGGDAFGNNTVCIFHGDLFLACGWVWQPDSGCRKRAIIKIRRPSETHSDSL